MISLILQMTKPNLILECNQPITPLTLAILNLLVWTPESMRNNCKRSMQWNTPFMRISHKTFLPLFLFNLECVSIISQDWHKRVCLPMQMDNQHSSIPHWPSMKKEFLLENTMLMSPLQLTATSNLDSHYRMPWEIVL